MTWGNIAVGVGGAVLGSMSDKGSKGGASQSTSKEPWAKAAPWLEDLLGQGQSLDAKYRNEPFNPRQRTAYDNSYAQSDYVRGLVPGLLGQLGSQQVGFDRNNPTARVKAFDWNVTGGGLGQQSVRNVPETPVAPAPSGPFTQQTMETGPVFKGFDLTGKPADNAFGNGALGSFKYGMQPAPGTQAYRDMQEYLAWGGEDPYGLYGKQSKYTATEMSLLGGGNSGGSVGGSPAGDGSGGGSAGGNSW